MTDKIHVLVIPSWYKTKEHPLAGTFFEEQVRMLQRNGCQVGVVYPKFDAAFKFPESLTQLVRKGQPDDFKDDGIPTLYSYSKALLPSRFRRWSYEIMCRQVYRKYKKYVRAHGKPDIIHAHSVYVGGYAARYISKREGMPYVFTEHSSGLLQSKWVNEDQITRSILRATFIDASLSTFVSTDFLEKITSNFNLPDIKSEVVPNLVNPLFYQEHMTITSIRPFKVLCIALMTKNKQHRLLIDAIQLLIDKGCSIELNLIGDGPEKNELIEYTKERNLTNFVAFMGQQPRNVVKEEIDKANLVVSASKYESFGLSIVEALACGRPVVAIDSGGPRDTINASNGLLVSENTPEKLAEGILSVMDNYQSYDQEKIVMDCINNYSEEAIFSKLLPIYKEAISNTLK